MLTDVRDDSSETGFETALRPQAVGTTQKSQLCNTPTRCFYETLFRQEMPGGQQIAGGERVGRRCRDRAPAGSAAQSPAGEIAAGAAARCLPRSRQPRHPRAARVLG